MGTFVYSSSCLSWKNLSRQMNPSHHVVPRGVPEKGCSRIKSAVCSKEDARMNRDCEISAGSLNRRSAIISGASLISSVLLFPGEGSAVIKQGLLAGRVPGLSEPDEEGWRTYRRPDDKSGGHGVGWSPMIPYTFSVPDKWEEVPVSIADLGGTEIDLRFANPKEGRVIVIVAPVKRFSDEIGEEATIEQIGPPDKVISAFGPEVIGENVEGKVLRSEVAEHEGRTYYQFELEPPHVMITATAAGNRLYLFNVTGNGNVFGVLLFMAPMITFKRIISKRSTEQFTNIPYVIALLNCLLSVWYSLPFVSPDNLLVTIVNSIGAGLEATYVLIFLIFAPKKEKAKICGYLVVVFSIVSCVALVSLLAFHGNKRKLLCGFAFTVSCIVMYGSPLSVMRRVIKSKSVEYMPFFLSLAVFICSLSWFFFALLGKDPFILVPNAIGTLLGAMQLILYAIYRANEVKKDEMNESVETRTGELQDKKLAYNEDA